MNERDRNRDKPDWRILLLEDDEDDYILACSWLSTVVGGRYKYELHWARTVDQAFETLSRLDPDVILVDHDLGGQSGIDFVRRLNARGNLAPVIMLTGRGNYEVDLEAMQAGATDYLAKNEVTPHMLERAIRYALERRQREEVLQQAKELLETRVQERTRELSQKYAELQAEITERERVQAQLAEMQRRLIDSLEAERLQLAQELHDGPMQDLYAMAYQLQTLRNGLEGDPRGELLPALQETVQRIVHTLRATTGELRPPTLVPFGLEKAIRSHCEIFQTAQPGLQIQLQLTPDGQLLPETLRLALFRIYQMALTNVARHAQASRVDIRLLLDAETVILEIQDDGVGFEVPDHPIQLARRGKYGLLGALERASSAGGKLQVESSPGEGTLVRVTVPMDQAG